MPPVTPLGLAGIQVRHEETWTFATSFEDLDPKELGRWLNALPAGCTLRIEGPVWATKVHDA